MTHAIAFNCAKTDTLPNATAQAWYLRGNPRAPTTGHHSSGARWRWRIARWGSRLVTEGLNIPARSVDSRMPPTSARRQPRRGSAAAARRLELTHRSGHRRARPRLGRLHHLSRQRAAPCRNCAAARQPTFHRLLLVGYCSSKASRSNAALKHLLRHRPVQHTLGIMLDFLPPDVQA